MAVATSMTGGERHDVSLIGKIWIQMYQEKKPATIYGVMEFDELIDPERVIGFIQKEIIHYPRFTSILRYEGRGRPYFEKIMLKDIRPMATITTIGERRDGAEGSGKVIFRRSIDDYVSTMMMKPFDPSLPRWEMHFLLSPSVGKSALVIKICHCLGDGVMLLALLLSLSTDSSGSQLGQEIPQGEKKLQSKKQGLTTAAGSGDTKTTDDDVANARTCVSLLTSFGSLLEILWLGLVAFFKVLLIPLAPADEVTAMSIRVGRYSESEKRVHFSRELQLNDVKEIGRALGATVNDVMLAVQGGGIRRYLANRKDSEGGQVSTKLRMGAVVLVDLWSLQSLNDLKGLLQRYREGTVDNNISMFFVNAPVHQCTPVDRVAHAMKESSRIKRSPEPLILSYANRCLGWFFGPGLCKWLMCRILSRHTFFESNLAGPKQKIYFAGYGVSSFYNCTCPASLSTGISIMSYNNVIRFAISVDPLYIPDPLVLAECIITEYEELLLCVRKREEEGRKSHLTSSDSAEQRVPEGSKGKGSSRAAVHPIP